MSVTRSNYYNSERSVVIVDAARFVELWRAHPYKHFPKLSYGNVASWREDYKFQYAEEGFSHGKKNPVPLAEVFCYTAEVIQTPEKRSFFPWLRSEAQTASVSYIAFRNGVTRTIWLLANGARAFPVECPTDQIDTLAKLAGLIPPETVENLTNPIKDLASIDT